MANNSCNSTRTIRLVIPRYEKTSRRMMQFARNNRIPATDAVQEMTTVRITPTSNKLRSIKVYIHQLVAIIIVVKHKRSSSKRVNDDEVDEIKG